MSEGKQGFPLSLQEKRIEFDDTLECSKVSCFTAVQLGVGVTFSSGFLQTSLPSGSTRGAASLRISYLKRLLTQMHKFGMCAQSRRQSSHLFSLTQHWKATMSRWEPFQSACVTRTQVSAVMHVLRGCVFCCFPLVQRNAPVRFTAVLLQRLQKKATFS